MSLSAIAITTLAKAGSWLGIDPTSFVRPAFKVYHDGAGGATTATVAVSATTLTLDSSVGSQDEALSLTAGATDTLSELLAVPLAAEGWIIQQLYLSDALSADLVITASASCFGAAAEQTMYIEDNRGLELIIEGVTAEIETWLGRGIVSRTYLQDVYLDDGCSPEPIVLPQPDVTAVEAIRIDTLQALTVTYTGSEVRATVQVTSTGVVQKHGSTTTTTLFASATTLAAMETAMEAAGAGWAVTIASNVSSSTPSTLLVRTPGRSCKSVSLQINCWEDFDGDYEVNYDAGVVDFNSAGTYWPYSSRDRWGGCCCASRIQVAYTAGFSTVPFDVEQVALSMIADEFSSRGRDTKLTSESLEGYSYNYGKLEGNPEWQRRLAKYQRILP